MRRVVLPLLLAALLSGCATDGTETEEPTTGPTFAGLFGAPTPAPTASVPEVCLELEAEVTAVTQTTLLVPPVGGGGGGYIECFYELAPEVDELAGGCHCLSVHGPLDAEGQGTDWLINLPEGGEMLVGVGDGAYYLPRGERAADLWVVRGQAVLYIGIDQQYLTGEQLAQLADVALDRLASGAWH